MNETYADPNKQAQVLTFAGEYDAFFSATERFSDAARYHPDDT
jgi:hypothetical protein